MEFRKISEKFRGWKNSKKIQKWIFRSQFSPFQTILIFQFFFFFRKISGKFRRWKISKKNRKLIFRSKFSPFQTILIFQFFFFFFFLRRPQKKLKYFFFLKNQNCLKWRELWSKNKISNFFEIFHLRNFPKICRKKNKNWKIRIV